MKLGVTLDILNQKDTPAFYADTLANRPAAGFTGRVFISTDTLDLYRDTGTTWVLLSPSSTGTITGSGAAGQVTYFSAASSITGNNNLFWDSANNHLGIQTATPDCALDVNHNGTFVAKFNNTTTANTLIGIYNLDNPQWLIGSNSVANDLTFYDATNFPTLVATTTMKTDGTTFIGGQTTGSGRLNVYSATGDNGIQISGANAPSLRIDNAPTGATKRIGFGISTATNNFIQGSADRDMCIFNGSTTASPMLFGIYDTTNVQEAARISAARNFLINTTTDTGQKLQVNGNSYFNGHVGIGSSTSPWGSNWKALEFLNGVYITALSNTSVPLLIIGTNAYFDNSNFIYKNSGEKATRYQQDSGTHYWYNAPSGTAGNNITFNQAMTLTAAGNLLLDKTTDTGQKLQVNGSGIFTGLIVNNNGEALRAFGVSPNVSFYDSSNTTRGGYINHDGSNMNIVSNVGKIILGSNVNISSIPTSAVGLVSGDLYRLGSVINIVP